jgi:drug/metabolite transporter (DMT)-like permease
LADPAPASPPASNLRTLLAWALFLAIETLTQIVFKWAGASLDLDQGFWTMAMRAVRSPFVIGGFALYLSGFFVWMTILREGDLGHAFPLTSLVYITTLVAAVTLFHETLNPTRLLGVAVIIAGVVILSRDHDASEVSQPTTS